MQRGNYRAIAIYAKNGGNLLNCYREYTQSNYPRAGVKNLLVGHRDATQHSTTVKLF